MIKELFGGPYAWLAKWGVISLLVVSFGAFCWFKGDMHGTDKLHKYQAAQAIETSRVIIARQAVTNTIGEKHVKEDAATVTRYKRTIGLLVAEAQARKQVPVNARICSDTSDNQRLSDAVSRYFERDRQIAAGERARITGLLEQAERQTGQLTAAQEWAKAQEKVK